MVLDIRGNLNTRLAKLDASDSKYVGIILAQAGLVRMGWNDRISQVLEPSDVLYAVGQGALAVECRVDDMEILNMLKSLMCLSTSCRILAERSFLKTLGGGCSAPVAVWSKLIKPLPNDSNSQNELNLHLDGAVWSLNGSTEIRDKISCCLDLYKDEVSSETDESSNEGPPSKRLKVQNNQTNLQQNSPPIINSDSEVKDFNIDEELLKKHITLVKKCPVLNSQTENSVIQLPGIVTADANTLKVCPLPLDIGQDVMGKCPFIGNELLSETSENLKNSTLEAHKDLKPSTSKCPFAGAQGDNAANLNKDLIPTEHLKCPFLLQTIKMHDVPEAEKTHPPQVIEDISNLFCGIYLHACYSRDLFEMCQTLGQQLADQLIKQGALEIMKIAQEETHSSA